MLDPKLSPGKFGFIAPTVYDGFNFKMVRIVPGPSIYTCSSSYSKNTHLGTAMKGFCGYN